eukprot:624-Heterococcus_DN1.PRE.1
MWKGLRDAHCGWLQAVERWEGGRVVEVICDSSSSSSSAEVITAAAATAASREGLQGGSGLRIGLYLVILAPQRGFVEIWRARYGPCVRTLPAPPDAHLRLVHSSAAGGLARCFMLSSDSSNSSSSSSDDNAQRSHCIRAQQLAVTEADLLCLPKVLCRGGSADEGRDKLQRVT